MRAKLILCFTKAESRAKNWPVKLIKAPVASAVLRRWFCCCLFIVYCCSHCLLGFSVGFLFCCVVLGVLSSFAIIN